jgi:phenylalanyl-tRNA synthetase alpha chain
MEKNNNNVPKSAVAAPVKNDEEKERVAQQIVDQLNSGSEGIASTKEWADKHQCDHLLVVGVVKSLQSRGIVVAEQFDIPEVTLTAEGQHAVAKGSPEYILCSYLKEKGEPVLKLNITKLFSSDEKEDREGLSVAMGQAMKNKWLTMSGKDKEQTLSVKSELVFEDTVRAQLQQLNKLTKDALEGLKKRKLILTAVIKAYKVIKGESFTINLKQEVATDLTADLLVNDAWKQANFKAYNLKALGISPTAGHLHPLLKVRAEFREIFLELGFQEMPTNKWIESSFWNFDALFTPQQHPARDAHDTFFMSEPAATTQFPEEYLQKVAAVHGDGVAEYGTRGWRYDWKLNEAQRNVLRTHTTAISTRMLYKLAQQYKETGVFTPKKYFSIDRVFRNENLDATHLAEFHQIEGLIADRGLSLTDLIGSIAQFFERYGITNIKFKPAYNPYTEPSMEIFGYHPDLKRWVEIGNSGMFRPEMLLPMGLPEDVNVIAWGFGLERPTMIKYRLENIRDLVGHGIDLNFVRNNPICRLDNSKKSADLITQL